MASKLGDSGKTRTLQGRITDKDDLLIQAGGGVDELNSLLGWAGLVQTKEIREYIHTVQQHLFVLGAEISAGGEGVPVIDDSHLNYLVWVMERLNMRLPSISSFILPGQSEASSRLHIARCVARRTEVLLVSLRKAGGIGEGALAYMNRLSELLFIMARYSDQP